MLLKFYTEKSLEVDDVWLQAAAIIVLLALSAFFSSIESAYFSLSRTVLDKLRQSNDSASKRVAKLLENPRRLLATILAGNTIVNTIASALAALMAVNLASKYNINASLAIIAEVVIITVFILILGELIPKLMALRNPEKWALNTSGSVVAAWWTLGIIATPLAVFSAKLSQLLGVERHNTIGMTEDEIMALVQVGHEHGVLKAEERRLIHSIFEFSDTIAREIMVPRIDVKAVDVTDSLEELVSLIVKHGHSRIPIYDDDIDNIIGMVHAKDLLPATEKPESFDLRKILRPVHFVPAEKPIGDLLRELQNKKLHMAIVMDEYSGTAGLLTLEDIIEEIVGEIHDEYDFEQPSYRRLDERTIMANGKLAIYQLNEILGLDLISEDESFDTLAGFVYSQLGVVPQKGQQVEFNGYRFIVEEVVGRRIMSVRVMKERGVFEDA